MGIVKAFNKGESLFLVPSLLTCRMIHYICLWIHLAFWGGYFAIVLQSWYYQWGDSVWERYATNTAGNIGFIFNMISRIRTSTPPITVYQKDVGYDNGATQ